MTEYCNVNYPPLIYYPDPSIKSTAWHERGHVHSSSQDARKLPQIEAKDCILAAVDQG
jgi:hypothetical protein